MDKRKILIIIISILLVVLIVLGVILYLKDTKSSNNSFDNEIYDETSVEEAIPIPAESPDNVIEEIKNFYTDTSDATVTFDKEEDNCWYFSDSDGNSYTYCLNNPEILKSTRK